MNNLILHRSGASIFDDMNRLFDGVLSNPVDSTIPLVDIQEANDQYELRAELPGLDQKDIDVNIKEGLLTIKTSQETEAKDTDETADAKYLLRERRSPNFSRSFRLPRDVESENIKAEFANGLLTLRIPKAEAARPRSIKID